MYESSIHVLNRGDEAGKSSTRDVSVHMLLVTNFLEETTLKI